jgi:hypothetical protein
LSQAETKNKWNKYFHEILSLRIKKEPMLETNIT